MNGSSSPSYPYNPINTSVEVGNASVDEASATDVDDSEVEDFGSCGAEDSGIVVEPEGPVLPDVDVIATPEDDHHGDVEHEDCDHEETDKDDDDHEDCDDEYVPSDESSEDESEIAEAVKSSCDRLGFIVNENRNIVKKREEDKENKTPENDEKDQENEVAEESSEEDEEEPGAKKVLAARLEQMERSSKDGHKQHCCLFCGELKWKLPRHYEDKHSDQERVKEALSYKEGSKERKRIWTELRREGDFAISIDAYQQNLQPVCVRKTKSEKEMLPCTVCKGWFVARHLSRHKCFAKKNGSVKSARVFVITNTMDDDFKEVHEKLIVGIKDPELKVIIRNDPLLLALGAVELDNKDRRRYHDTRYTLRVVAKLLIAFRKRTSENHRAIDLIQPENYDQMLKTVKSVAGYKGRTDIENPHIIMKFGYSLRTLAILGEMLYTKKCDWKKVKRMKAMQSLYEKDFTNYINHAKCLYELRGGNLPEELPLEEDLRILRNYCIEQITHLVRIGDEKISQRQLSELARLCFTRLCTFNARRGGEPGKLTLKDWGETLKDTWKSSEDIKGLTDPVEVKLAERLKLCYLPGKKKKKGMCVPFCVLLL